ncbi:uncharacterized protein LOC128309149 [Anopheles moucheti]|uniref:uncharacterized protein LOC128309149 n=1 Tax=Anopheles moucheti TaxID=186751 RepID=UPI0022F0EBC1|nr:uncharacterized protein LOC128309149 [Anopheles moucheti]
MPFSIVQKRGPKGYSELCIVPDSWVQGTSTNKVYLFWPNVKGNINHLVMNDKSVPAEGWTKQQCWIKRQRLSYEDADSTITIMSGESSTDSGIAPILSNMKKPVLYADMFSERVVENSLKPIYSENEVNDILSQTSPIRSPFSDENAVRNMGTNEGCTDCATMKTLLEGQTRLFMDIRAEQKRDHEQLLKELKKITNRVGIIEVQLNTLLNHTEVGFNDQTRFDRQFDFVKELEQLEKDIEEEDYFIQISGLLKQELTDKDVNNRMLAALDALFERIFLTQCTWTGISKTGNKIAMHTFRNVIKLFQCIGSTKLVKVTDEMVKLFFMKRLKHAIERSMAKGFRRSTCRKRKLI